MTPQRLLSALEDLEVSLFTSDWSLIGHGDDWVEIRGWRALAPERYALICATALCVGWLYSAWLVFIGGAACAVWLSRRFRLRVSPEGELECCTSACGVTYRRLTLPLWAPLRSEGEGAVRLVRLGGDEALAEHLELLSCARPRAAILCDLINQTAQEAQRKRLESPERFHRPGVLRVEPGEWLVSVIEGAPTLLGPTSARLQAGGSCAWWAPSPGLIRSCALLVIVAPAISPLLSAPLLNLLCCWLIAALTLVSAREHVSVSTDGLVWRRSVLGFTVRERAWSLNARLQLESDSLTPSGRCVILYEPGRPESLMSLGSPWDARWIYERVTELVSAARR